MKPPWGGSRAMGRRPRVVFSTLKPPWKVVCSTLGWLTHPRQTTLEGALSTPRAGWKKHPKGGCFFLVEEEEEEEEEDVVVEEVLSK